jgi:hypothetical protein
MAQIHRTLWFRFLLLTLLSSMAWAQLPVAEDTFVASGTTTPSGTNTNLQVIASPINAALVKFDLSGVPAGTTGNQVTKATVKLYVNTVSLSGTLDVCQVTSPWTEASTVFTTKPTLSATPLATAVPVSTASKYIVVDITTAVQAWQNGTANNGIALLPSSATPCNSSTYGAPSTSINVKLDSKENISASHDAGLNVVLSLTNGTVTSVGTGEGLTGGPITTSGTIKVVPPSGNIALGGVKGPNATATCALGSHFSGIAVDGTLTCSPDSAATSLSFSAITSGTNTGQSLVVGSGSSLNPSGGTITANMLSTGTYGPGVNITGNAGTVTNGVYTTGSYADPSWITSLSGAKISSAVANAVFANSAGTTTNFSGSLSGDVTGPQGATVVSAIGGAAPSLFARRDQANMFTATQALAPKGNASQPSNLLQFNATDAASNSLSAQLQALNDGSLSFQFGPTGSAVQKLFIDNTGKITFAPGQTFPGSQTLTAGTGIAINSNAIDNTGVLTFNGRNGSVSPASGDYSFPQITGAITPAQVSTGLYGIDISGNANTANTAGSAGTAGTAGFATTAGDANNLGGQPANKYARLDIANSFTGNQSIAGNATITGTETVNGPLSLPATGSGPSASQPLDLAGADGSNQPALFRWQVNNTGKLDLLTATGGGSAMPSGLLIGSDGKITFAANQTFPGTQSLTAGTGIAINGNAIDNTGVLSFNGRNGSVSPATGDYSFAQITGAITSGQAAPGLYAIDISGNANTANTAGSAATAATAGDASNLGGVPAANYARRDTDNTFTGFLNATSSTGDAVVGTSTGGNAGVSGSGANGVVGTANGSVGSIGVRGDAAVVDGNIHFGVKGTAADPSSIAGVFDSTGAGTAKILSGQKNGSEVFSVAANGDVTGKKFTGDGSGLTNVSAGTFTGSINESQVTNLTSDLASKLTAASPLNAANLTGTVPTANLSGTYTININGNATTATTAGSAATAGTAGDSSNLGGVPAASYARRDTANTFTGDQTVTGFLNATSSTGDAVVGTSTGGNAGVSGSGANGVVGTANGSVGSIGVRGDAAVVDGNIHFGVKGTAADPNSIAGVFDSTGAGTAKILSGQKNGTEVFSVDANGKVTGDGSGLTNVSAGTFTGSITESQVTNLTSDLASKLTAASPLNAANLTGTVPSGNLSGSYNISVTSALTAGSATTATSAGTAAALQGTAVSNTAPTNGQVLQYNSTNTQWQPADITGSFIQNGTSQQTTASFNIDGTGVLGGSLTAGGAILPLTAAGNSKPSFPLDFKATGNTGTSNTFRLLANGTGATPVFDFQTCSGTSCTPSSTGLSIDNTGKVTFASGQTFPGTQTLTAGTGISIVSNAINNTGVTSLTGTANQISVSGGTGAVTLSLPTTVAVNITGSAGSAGTATTAGNFTGSLAGDVTGGQGTTTVGKINGTSLGTLSGATNGQTLTWNGSAWVPATPAATGAPAILTGWCTGAATVGTLGFSGLGGPATAQTSQACADTMTVGTAIGVPMTSAGTLKNLRVYPGTLANNSTSVQFTVYVAAAPGWSVSSTTNPNTTSPSGSNNTSGSGALAPGAATITIATTTNHFTNGDTVNVQLNSQTLQCNGNGGNSFNATALNGNRTLTAASATSISFTVTPSPCTAGNGNIAAISTTGTISDVTNPTFTTTTTARTTPSATSLTCTIGAPTTAAAAVCSDASDTVSINAGDLVSVIGTGGKAGETLGDIRVSLEKQ